MSADVLDPDRMPRRFWLVRRPRRRDVDQTEIVAEGAVWSSGKVTIYWPGRPVVTSLWACLDDLLAVQGDGGCTTVEWIDDRGDWPCGYIEYDGGAIWIH